MLDQNTDRMWFVIGALVVGAGIILLANKAMPEIFASVTDSFENVSKNATEVINDITPRTENLLHTYDLEWEMWPYLEEDQMRISRYYESFISEEIPTEPGTTYELVPANYVAEGAPTIVMVEYDQNGNFIKRQAHREMSAVQYTTGENTYSIVIGAKSFDGKLNGHGLYLVGEGD